MPSDGCRPAGRAGRALSRGVENRRAGARAAVGMEAGAPEGIQVSPDGGLDHTTW